MFRLSLWNGFCRISADFYRILAGQFCSSNRSLKQGVPMLERTALFVLKMSMYEYCVLFAWHWNSKDYISSISVPRRFEAVLVISNIWCRYSVVMFLPFHMHQKQSQNRHGVKNKRRFCHESSGVPKLKKELALSCAREVCDVLQACNITPIADPELRALFF